MRELNLTRPGQFRWLTRPDPVLLDDEDVIVRPFIVGRCDGDWLVTHSARLRALRLAQRLRLLDPILYRSFGPTPYIQPCAIGHECVGEVVDVGSAVTTVAVGDKVVIPFQVSCGRCEMCRRGLTSLCTTAAADTHDHPRVLSWYGHGPATGPYGGMAADLIRVPFGNHMAVPVPAGLDPLRIAAASDNLSDAWRVTVPLLQDQANARVLVVGGLARAIGLYAAGIAATLGARVDYLDSRRERLDIAESLGATPIRRSNLIRFPQPKNLYDHVIDASNLPTGIVHAVQSTAPGGTCITPSYHLALRTGIPLMHMTFNNLDLAIGMNNPGTTLSDVLEWVHANDFPAEKVTTAVINWDDAPENYAQRATKLVMYRPPLHP